MIEARIRQVCFRAIEPGETISTTELAAWMEPDETLRKPVFKALAAYAGSGRCEFVHRGEPVISTVFGKEVSRRPWRWSKPDSDVGPAVPAPGRQPVIDRLAAIEARLAALEAK